MKTVIFGEDVFTAAVFQSILNGNHEVLMVVSPIYENNNSHSKIEAIAKNNSINFVRIENVNSDYIRDLLIASKPDLLVSVHLRKILKKEIFTIPSLGAINIHPSLLPKYRGLSPQHQTILHGDSESGVSVHFIDETVDTGHIVAQTKIAIKPDDYISDFQLKMLKVYKSIIVTAIDRISKADFVPIVQKQTDISYFHSIKLKDREIVFSKTKTEALNLIRAVSYPYKGAYTNNITVWRAEIPSEKIMNSITIDSKKLGAQIINDDLLILCFNDGILISEDFEIK
jgi:methionyl-tRNA formyltransferase